MCFSCQLPFLPSSSFHSEAALIGDCLSSIHQWIRIEIRPLPMKTLLALMYSFPFPPISLTAPQSPPSSRVMSSYEAQLKKDDSNVNKMRVAFNQQSEEALHLLAAFSKDPVRFLSSLPTSLARILSIFSSFSSHSFSFRKVKKSMYLDLDAKIDTTSAELLKAHAARATSK